MAVKKCCVENCNSCSSRKEDIGVTYHKFPKDAALRGLWINMTHHRQKTNLPSYVCSRHFCKSDFKIYKDSKYVLKSDAIPSIFSWNMTDKEETLAGTTEMESVKKIDNVESDVKETLNSSKESEPENMEAIKKYIEDQDKYIADQKVHSKTIEDNATKPQRSLHEDCTVEEGNKSTDGDKIDNEPHDEIMAVASSVMDMILTESEARIVKKKNTKSLNKQTLHADKGNSMALSVGSKVEAKDFGEYWHPAQIIEVDYEEMEVLVHYDNDSKKHDEWINVSSPRLRPLGTACTQISTPAVSESAPVSATLDRPIKEEPKHEDKSKLTFAVGERCLARYRDNRRFIATINAELGDGKYEIMFDDGVRWTCKTIRLYKLKDTTKKDPLTVDTTSCSSAASTPSPVYGAGPSTAGATPVVTTPLPAFHTHLFDPARDYLGTKSERREMKRKLNIKELFNIGQKKQKIDTRKVKPPKIVKEKKSKVVKKKVKLELQDEVIKTEPKKEIPDAVASIIGTVTKYESAKTREEDNINEFIVPKDEEDQDDLKSVVDDSYELANSETLSAPETLDIKHDEDSVLEEVKLEQFDQPTDNKHEEVIGRIKEVIIKLEGGLSQSDVKVEKLISPKIEVKEELNTDDVAKPVVSEATTNVDDTKIEIVEEKPKKNLSKVKKGKKLRLLQEKKVKKQVEKVKSELEEMKKQVEEMRQQMLLKTEELAKTKQITVMPDSFLLPGEWCCKWVNGQPVGPAVEMESDGKVDANSKPALPRRSVQVEDKRLPPDWTKHMVRRSLGNSAGKWDVVLMSPDNRKFHTKTEMIKYLEANMSEGLEPYTKGLLDFGVHLKLSRRMGWWTTTPGGEQESPVTTLLASSLNSASPLTKRKTVSLKSSIKKSSKMKEKKLRLKLKVPRKYRYRHLALDDIPGTSSQATLDEMSMLPADVPPLEDGYVYVGSLKVQIIENLLRCPAEGCFKNFRNNTLLKMHIKHYHRDLRKMLGATPKVLDLAYARTRPTEMEMRRLKLEAQHKTIKIKLPRLPKRITEPKPEIIDPPTDIPTEAPATPNAERIPRSQDSPKLRKALVNKPVKRPKVLLPVRRPEPMEPMIDIMNDETDEFEDQSVPPVVDAPNIEPLDFETAISTHTVTKPVADGKRKGEKKRKSFATISKKAMSEDEEWFTLNNSDVETRSSYPRSGTPDSKIMDPKMVSSESNEDQKDLNYLLTENGERIKIVHMKREEIINCHCGFREEDGLMVQCELCLCWQHALCHNIQKESEVPEKYTCSICLNPRRGRRSQRFLHDQDRLYEGLLPGAKPCESLRRSHELSGNLLRIEDALHALRVKYFVATKKDHPKLYLWAKDWETGEINMTQEKLNSDYSDLNIMISNIGKENLPIKPEEIKDMPLDIRTPPSDEAERFSQRDGQLGSQALLSGLLSSPGGASLDLPISSSDLETLANSVQEVEPQRCVIAPQPEAAIENSACRERLLRHIQRCQALIDARLDSIEAQVAELESQDPSFEDDETADFFPRTKQTVQMLTRDLDTMEELGIIT